MVRRDVINSAMGKVFGGERRDVTEIAREKGVGGGRRDVTDSASGKVRWLVTSCYRHSKQERGRPAET